MSVSETMNAVVLTPAGVEYRTDYPRPMPGAGEVLVRVSLAGICETDLQLMRGYMGFQGVPGHEFVGVAESGEYAGRRVVGEINNACRQCEYCRGGLQRHCPHRSVLGILNHDGAFAEYVAVPEVNLHPVPEELPDELAVFTEPVAAAYEILEQLTVPPGAQILVLGDGRLGNLCAQVLARTPGRVRVVGKHPGKLALLRSLGIETVLLDELALSRCADVVVDCTGSATGLPAALQLVKPRGTVVMKTTVAGEQTLALAPIVIDEITLLGSRCGPFDRALQALQRQEIGVRPLISHRCPLSEAVAALEQARTQPVLKILLDVNAG